MDYNGYSLVVQWILYVGTNSHYLEILVDGVIDEVKSFINY